MCVTLRFLCMCERFVVGIVVCGSVCCLRSMFDVCLLLHLCLCVWPVFGLGLISMVQWVVFVRCDCDVIVCL